MNNDEIVANTLGAIGTFFWCVQLVPQIWRNYRKKDTDGLPSAMLLIWGASSVPFGAYCFIQDFALPLQLQPQIFAILSLVTWGQILYYDRKLTFFQVLLSVIGTCALIAGGEAVFVYGSKLSYQAGVTWHTTVIAVFAGVLFIVGFLPAVIEIWSRRGRVAGISFGFLAIDSSGALFSLAALGFHEFGIASSHLIWLWRTRKLHAKAKELGVVFDELPEASPYQRQGDKIIRSDSHEPLLEHNSHHRYGSFSSPNNQPLARSGQTNG